MSDDPRRPLVLVAGAWLGAWAWRSVADRLRALGSRDVYPVTLTGLADRVHLARPDVDLTTHVTDVVNLLDFEDLHDTVLVGHSYGGVVITGAADRRPERVHAAVYVDTRPLPSRTAVADAQAPEARRRQQQDVEQHGDGWRWPPVDRDTLLSGTFGSAAGLTDHHLALLAERATPQPYATFTTPLELTHDRPPRVRRVAVVCTGGGLDLALLRALIAQGDPRVSVFADDWELRELPTGHWPMLSTPDALAALLHDVAATPHDPDDAHPRAARRPGTVGGGRIG